MSKKKTKIDPLATMRFLERIPGYIKSGESISNQGFDSVLGKGLPLLGMIAYIERNVNSVKPVPFPFPKNLKKKIPRYSGKARIFNLDYWRWEFDRTNPPRFYGWEELINFFRIRHCVVHNMGYLLPGHSVQITDFLKSLHKNKVKDRKGSIIKSYYHIDGDDKIIMENGLRRLAILCMEFFVLTGVLKPIILNTGELIKF